MCPDSLAMVFGRRLRFLRTMAKMTQARLAEESGISIDHLSKIERGLSSPSFVVIERLAEVMGVRPASLFDDGAPNGDHEAPDGAGTYLRELRHRTKNSFAVLAALTDLACLASDGDETRAVCQDLSAKIRHMALLNEMLSNQSLDDTMDLAEYLRHIVGQLSALYPLQRLDLHVAGDNVLLPARKALPFGLAAFELLTNAYKHADGASRVSVQVTDGGDDRITVHIADNGPGFTGDGDCRRRGRGLSLVRTLVEDQLGGDFTLRTCGGAEAVLSFRVTD